MPYHPPPANAPWYTPPGNPSMVPPEQRIYHTLQPVYAHTAVIQQYPASSASAPTLADHDQLERHRAPERASMPGPVQAALFMPYTAPIARAPTMAECDESDRRRALGLPPLPWPTSAPTATQPVSAAYFSSQSSAAAHAQTVSRGDQSRLHPVTERLVSPWPPSPDMPTEALKAAERKIKRDIKQRNLGKFFSRKAKREREAARRAVEKAEKAKNKVNKVPPPKSAAELRREEEKKQNLARPWPPYMPPPIPFPAAGACTYTPQIGTERKRKPMPSRWTTMCGTYAAGPHAGKYGQEYWEDGGGFQRCISETYDKHQYERDLPEAPEDSFMAAALLRGELHTGDFRGAYLDHEGRTYPSPPPPSASQDWQKYLHESQPDYERGERVPTYRPPSPTARPIPFRTREVLPDMNFTMDKLAGRGERWDPEAERMREVYMSEIIGDHGLWVRNESWVDGDRRNDEPPPLFLACNMIPAGSLMAAAMDDGDFAESDSEDEGYGATLGTVPAL